MTDGTPTPLTRRRTTRRSVYFVDRITTFVITLGGLVVVAAVLGIAIYLIAVTGKLFLPGELRAETDVSIPLDSTPILFHDVDESTIAAVRLLADGRAQLIHLETGAIVSETDLLESEEIITAFVRSPRDNHIAAGLSDGRVRIGDIGFSTEFLNVETEPEALSDLEIGESRVFEDAIAERTPLRQIRLTRIAIDLADSITLRAGEGPVRLIDYRVGAGKEYLVAIRDDGGVTLNEVRKRPNLAGGPPRISLRPHTITLPPEMLDAPPIAALILGDGYSLLLVWEDGRAVRVLTENPSDAQIAEELRLVEPGVTVTALAKMIGEHTVIVGDSSGGIAGWFASRNELADTPDKRLFVKAHPLAPLGDAIEAIDVSTRGRTFVAVDRSGHLTIRNMTSHARVADAQLPENAIPKDVLLAPKVDAALALDQAGVVHRWTLDAPHPDASVQSLFGKVWYEGDPEPSYNYQSSSGDDAAEAKYNLVPLIFGTLKATIYTMLISIPFGILAAIYTSEFLSPRIRTSIKPSIEMMASLPSVVLGFIAAMLLAPLVRDWLPGVLLAFVGVPVGVLLGAYLWHFVPVRYMNRATAGGRLTMIMGLTIIAGWVSVASGPLFERALFHPSEEDVLVRAGGYEAAPRDEWPDWVQTRASIGAGDVRRLRQVGLYYRNGEIVRPAGSLSDPDIQRQIELHGYDEADVRAWLDGVIGGPWPGWFILAFPAGAIVVTLLVTRHVDPRLRAWDRRHSPTTEAGVELLKFLGTLVFSAIVAALLATALTGAGLDARDSIFGTFQQRNTLVVGIAMSVAVIPIIYTIADDAMTSVPDTLRSASLGAGATRWQTAVRVVLPVAMSGVFSACMIGLGRAAGETMIVLMATGNTPIMSWSVFDGLRTLSANIAVELPEAPKDATHYRVLFLCGLVLFAMTFTINTAAEIIRQRVRKRSASL